MPTVNVQNTETLKLYKNQYLYNGSRYQYLMTGRTDNVSFETWLGNPDYSKQVYYKSISEPILINEAINNCDEYTYGSITVSSKDNNNQDVVKTYYFFVDNISTDAYKQTTINYTIDWWTTNWANIHPKVAHLTRAPTKPLYMEQPFTPLKTTVTKETLSDKYCFGVTYIPSTETGTSYISSLFLEGNEITAELIDAGNWYYYLDMPGADIKDCFVVPIFSLEDIVDSVNPHIIYQIRDYKDEGQGHDADAARSDFIMRFRYILPLTSGVYYHLEDKVNGHRYTATYNSSATDNIAISNGWSYSPSQPLSDVPEYNLYYVRYQSADIIIRYLESQSPRTHTGVGITPEYTPKTIVKTEIESEFYSNEVEKQGIIDWNGNIVWECPYGQYVESFEVTLLKGISHVLLQFLPKVNDSTNLGDMLTGTGFCYDCRHPGLFVDSYQDYVLKNRDYDIQMRKIQSDKQELQAWISTAENVGFGAAFGQKSGAAAAGIGGIIEAVGTRLINEIFDPQIQTQYDKRYQRMTDQISLVGDSITNIYIEDSMIKYVLSMDSYSKDVMKSDIDNNGFVCDEITNDLETMFKATITTVVDGQTYTVKPVFQADNVVVEGACNVIGKQQVVRRLQNGVEFI